ncbi:BTB/POZ domain-containing protein 19 isoform X3 [Tenrec ecaudatus]|uniref:BTB/POZ domain-containing protein 19 isoform X3 n=1 Tax=Tenrec ecaudatus TaxID=94439 RepID=UPI003F59DC32
MGGPPLRLGSSFHGNPQASHRNCCLARLPALASTAASPFPTDRPLALSRRGLVWAPPCVCPVQSLLPLPPASLGPVPKIQLLSQQACQAPSKTFPVSSPTLAPGQACFSPLLLLPDQRAPISSTGPSSLPTHGGPGPGGARGACALFHCTRKPRQQPSVQRLLGTEAGPGVPDPVVLSTVPAEAFLAVLQFLYTNSVKLHRHSVLEVLTAAVEYGLEELRELCLEFVVKVLDVELVCEALQVAVTLGLKPLQERCVTFIEAHSQAVLERPAAELAAPVVRELRLALLAPAELRALEAQNRREPLIPVEQIVEAWRCHALRRGDVARGALCRRRRGTLPREHHRFLDLPFQ